MANITARVSPRQNIVVSALNAGQSFTLPIASGKVVTATTLADQTLDSFPKSLYRGAKYQLQALNGDDSHFLELTVVHNNTDVFLSQYGEIYTNQILISIDAEIDAGENVKILVSPVLPNTTTTFARTQLVT